MCIQTTPVKKQYEMFQIINKICFPPFCLLNVMQTVINLDKFHFIEVILLTHIQTIMVKNYGTQSIAFKCEGKFFIFRDMANIKFFDITRVWYYLIWI